MCVSHWVIAILLHSVCSVLRDPEINIQTHPWAMNLCQPPHLLLSTHSITNTLFGFAYIRSCCGRLEDVSTRLFASIDRDTFMSGAPTTTNIFKVKPKNKQNRNKWMKWLYWFSRYLCTLWSLHHCAKVIASVQSILDYIASFKKKVVKQKKFKV